MGYPLVFVVVMLGLGLLFSVPHILLFVFPPDYIMFGRPGSILCFPLSCYLGLHRIVPSSLMLAGRPAVVGGSTVLWY